MFGLNRESSCSWCFFLDCVAKSSNIFPILFFFNNKNTSRSFSCVCSIIQRLSKTLMPFVSKINLNRQCIGQTVNPTGTLIFGFYDVFHCALVLLAPSLLVFGLRMQPFRPQIIIILLNNISYHLKISSNLLNLISLKLSFKNSLYSFTALSKSVVHKFTLVATVYSAGRSFNSALTNSFSSS